MPVGRSVSFPALFSIVPDDDDALIGFSPRGPTPEVSRADSRHGSRKSQLVFNDSTTPKE